MACTATEGNTSWPNASRITSEDIRLRDVTNCPNTWTLLAPHHAVTVEQPSPPPHVPSFKPSAPEIESTDALIRAPQRIPGIVDGEVVIRTPDPRPQPLPCRTMLSGMDNLVNCSTPWGLPPHPMHLEVPQMGPPGTSRPAQNQTGYQRRQNAVTRQWQQRQWQQRQIRIPIHQRAVTCE